MIAGFHPPSRALAFAFLASIALHVAVLLDLDWQPARHSTRPSVIVARLIASEGKPTAWPRLNPRDIAPRPKSPRRETAPAPSPVSAPPQVAEPAPPPSRMPGQDLPVDQRVREVVATAPSIYGLPDKYPAEEGELPYAWSDDLDTPPQATHMSRTRFPSEADSDGLVLVRAILGVNGSVGNFEVLCGAPPFDEVARESAPQWEFAPPTSRGRPARAWMLLEFAFLKGNIDEGFDPSRADLALSAMRAKCAENLAAQPR